MASRNPAITSRDPVTTYARQVVAGKIIAGPHVRDACRRHLKDLEEGPARGIFFDIGAAKRAIGFFSDVLRLNGGEYEGLPYDLLLWQRFISGSLFGWKGPDGYRRFRSAYVETGKGSGKSPLAAGIGLYGLMADGEARAEVYAAATKKDQAMILFRDAVAMRDLSPDLALRLVKSGVGENAWNLAYHQTGSFFRPISADDGQSGPRPHIALLDEVHEHRTGQVVEMLRAGTKSRRQALMFMITNSGVSKTSVCWEYHDYGAKVAAGQIEDDSFFSYICALDEGDEPFKDEDCWHKANPSLHDGLPGVKYLREQVREARGMPGKESIVRRLNFCQWVEAEAPWIGSDVWFSAQDKGFDADQLYGRRCWGGLDLSSTQDLTAMALLFEPSDADPQWRLVVHFWLPNDGLHDKADRDRVPYIVWRDAGYLHTTPGRAIDLLYVATQAAEIASLYDLQSIGYDRWQIEGFKQLLGREGISLPLEPFGQGFKDMSPALNEFERLLISGHLRHGGNPVMTWCAANAVTVSDPAGNRKVSKEKATGRIDGIVAAIMAAGGAAVGHEEDSTVEIIVL
ncbi:MAG: terminase large subunit [Rhodocyclaceae bacterium]|nr:terminase large subunit [Rhodocyclaceae bacterium]